MYLNFSNFRGRTSAGGGDKPWSKNGDKCRMGGIDKIFAGWGNPQSPQEKTLIRAKIFASLTFKWANIVKCFKFQPKWTKAFFPINFVSERYLVCQKSIFKWFFIFCQLWALNIPQIWWYIILIFLRGYCTSYQKLACFVLYLKIINTLKNNVCIL